MADPVSLVASVIAIAGLAYTSCKKLSELITSLEQAPKDLAELSGDLSIIQQNLQSLQSTLSDTTDAKLSDSLRKCLQNFNPSMEACSKACDDFAGKIKILEPPGKVTRFDQIRLYFKEKDITLFKSRLASHKATLNVAYGLATLVLVKDNREAVQDLEKVTIAATSKISGQVEGLQVALESLSIAEFSQTNKDIVKALEAHDVALRDCLKVCVEVTEALRVSSGHSIGLMEAHNNAKQLTLGTVGQASGNSQHMAVGKMVGYEDANQTVIGELEGKFAADVIGTILGTTLKKT